MSVHAMVIVASVHVIETDDVAEVVVIVKVYELEASRVQLVV